ncbi:hypothetical protein BC628DRAFT_1347435 [Trametes gibbosa]|nr:hypothetical protein BC628DRAFT_1347435 [Trametes gibbosa]
MSILTTCSPVSRPFPELPIEIVIQILEATAGASRSGARAISLLCTWARAIALPHLFATIVHRSQTSFSTTLSSGERTSEVQRHPSVPLRWGHFVRNLWTESSGVSGPSPTDNIFRVCPNVENLALMTWSIRSISQAVQACNANARRAGGQSSVIAEQAFLQRLTSITLITHTFRFDWHFLVGAQLQNGTQLCHNITHLHILDMRLSSFCPHNLLPNLTHLALPYLDLGNNFEQDTLRLPPGVLEHRALKMLVLTVEEEKWLTNPWYQIARYPGKDTTSPKGAFRTLVQWARERDDRVHVLLSPGRHVPSWQEWADTARGGNSLWQEAAEARARDSHSANLPDTYPKVRTR